jgi:nucleotide-binding universal stress UspA family protein
MESGAMIRDLVVNLGGGGTPDVTAAYAISLAKSYGAHVVGVAFVYEPVIPGSLLGGIPTDLIEVQREENAKAGKTAVAEFEAATRSAGVSAETRLLDASVAGASDLFGRIARRFDIAVVGQSPRDQGVSEELLIEGALFGSGRPVIVVPQVQTKPLNLDKVMICWDGSRPAARAIGDAIPLLARAKAIDIVVVTGERDKSGEITGANMKRHLARHGITVDIKRIAAGNAEVQSAILAQATNSGADFIVMGGYGHSRLREFILGGVTRSILKSMPVPVLMSH